MIVNNNNSHIGTQNIIEISAANTAAVSLLQQMSATLASDSSLGVSERASAQAAITEVTRSVAGGHATRETMHKSLDAISGIGSIAGLVSKVMDLF